MNKPTEYRIGDNVASTIEGDRWEGIPGTVTKIVFRPGDKVPRYVIEIWEPEKPKIELPATQIRPFGYLKR